jgi:hypothetical protein
MPVSIVSEASLDIVVLQGKIKDEEFNVWVRLEKLVGKSEHGVSFNAHTYETIYDNNLPLSTLFIVADGGEASNDPIIKNHLDNNPGQILICEEMVYVSNSLTKVAVVR